jgi:hypothetical protein
MYVEGDFNINLNEHPFFYSYSFSKNVFSDKTFNQKTERFFIIDEDYDLWLSFDFNIDPTTVVIAQKTDIGLLIHDCIQVKGGTEVLCNHLNTLGYNYNNFRLKVTGDTSGHSGSSSSGVSVNGVYNTDYSIITKVLGVPKPLIVHNKGVNEQYTLSRRTINVSFEQLPIFIHERCEILINDLATAQVMNNATNRDKLLKDRENHKQDAGDAFRYFMHALFLGKEKAHKSIMQYAMELNKEYNEQ